MEKTKKKKNAYSAALMEELTAVCDTFLPSIHLSDHHRHHQFYQTSASMTQTPHHLAELLGEKIKHPKIYLSRLALFSLSTRLGTFILCGRKSLSEKFPYLQRFSRVLPHKREQILLSWSESCFSLLRILYAGLKIFTLLVFFTLVNDKDENVSWKAIGYTRPDHKARKPVVHNTPHEKAREKGEECISEKERFGPLYNGIVNLNQSREIALCKLEKSGFPVSIPHSNGAKIKSSDPSFIVKCDVVVVGSGSGGGVVAGVLAEAGYKVLVLEKGCYIARSNLSLLEGQTIDQMYLGNGVLGTDNMDVLLLAGSTVGGGSTINWSASIRTPPHVRKDWSENHKLEMFDGEIYENALDVVCEKMGVQSEFKQEGFNSTILRKGCEKLGYPVESIPRNAGPDHHCGWCNLGCRDGKKKGVSETWLVDLVESGNGAILTECEALKVIVDQKDRKKRACGVSFMFGSDEVKEIAVIESKITVVACGAICTPPLLKRSGLKNRNIGRNLHLHPVVNAWGYFPDSPSSSNCNYVWPEAEKRSYEGAIMTAMSKVVEEHSGYSAAIIQTPALHPGMFSALMPWLSGRDIKDRMVKYSRTAHLFALVRDRGSGFVASPDHVGYKMDGADRENLRKGIERVLRVLAAAGAEEIGTHHRNGRVLKVKEAGEEELERFVVEESSRVLEENLSWPISSAHQMGSCRMGVGPRGSAVGPTGESWEVGGLFVADASVFPTALGVNPMVTVQAIAYCVAQCVVQSLGGKKLV
ncbi:hypothetical protein ABFS82_01G045400 [Erythranthe guttata]